MLSPAQLEALAAVARDGSIVAAAARLGYTPSAVSQQIAALERRTGLRLLDRRPREVRLTPAARAFLPAVEAAMAALRAAEAQAARLAGTQGGLVVIAAFPSATGTLLPAVMEQLTAALPRTPVRVDELEPANALAALRAGEADFALAYDFHDAPIDCAGMDRVEVGEDAFRLCVPSRHPLTRAGRVRLSDTVDQLWIADGPPSREECFAIRHLSRNGLRPVVAARSNDTLAVMRLVAQEVGLALLPGLQYVPVAGVDAVDLVDPPPPRRIFIATVAPEQSRRSVPTHAVLEELAASARRALTSGPSPDGSET